MNHCKQSSKETNYQKWIKEKGIELYGEHFDLYPEDQIVLDQLIAYFSNDQQRAKELDLNLDKGILLSGPIGSGKTSLMTLFRELSIHHSLQRFVIKPTREISYEFFEKGFSTIIKYSFGASYFGKIPIVYCFDDLGSESSLQYFGNKTNVLEEILLTRYDQFIQKGIKTHITTNKNSSEIQEIYGLRVRSRMREMFNLVSFPKNTKDKRK